MNQEQTFACGLLAAFLIVVCVGQTPDDPLYQHQWNLERIEAPGAWAVTRGAGVRIVVLDSGAAPHEELNAVLGDRFDDTGLGTAVTSVLAAAWNGIGMAGLCPEATVISKRVPQTEDGYANGLRWAGSHQVGAQIVVVHGTAWGFESRKWKRELGKFTRNGAGVVVCPSGNNGTITEGYPNDPGLIVVGGSTYEDTVFEAGSNGGEFLDCVAPLSATVCTTNGGYLNVGGTSYAAPLVAGTIALVLSAHPELTPLQAANRVLAACDDLGADPLRQGRGRLNARSAVR